MADYQLELRQIVDYPRCRIYREFMQTLIADRSIRTGGCSGLFYYVVLCSYANFRTSYRRIDGISYTVYPGEWICSIADITEWFRVRFHYQAFAILKSLHDRQLITFTRLGRGHMINTSVLGALGCDMDTFLRYFPAAETMYTHHEHGSTYTVPCADRG